MASNSLLPNKYFDKLAVNRLQAAEGIRSNNIESLTPSYLFSLVFEGTFERNNEGGILTIPKNTFESGIKFTDRPFRQTNDTFTLEEFTSLFRITTGYDSFEEDPPNGVLVHGKEQQTYEITLINESYESGNEYSKFNLKLLPGENHDFTTVTGRMSFFVDNSPPVPYKVKITDSDGKVSGPFTLVYANGLYKFTYKNMSLTTNLKILYVEDTNDTRYNTTGKSPIHFNGYIFTIIDS